MIVFLGRVIMVMIGVVVVVKMIVTPLAMWQLARLYGGDELAQGLALLCGAAPDEIRRIASANSR